MSEQRPETPTERVAVVVRRLTLGQEMTIGDVMRLTGLSRGASYNLMYRVSRVTPLVLDAGRWGLLERVSGADTSEQ